MIYIEMQLDGRVRISEIDDWKLLHKMQIEAEAEFLPVPDTMDEAFDQLQANCFQLEIFETFNHAANWAEHYAGFRAGEVRAEFARFERRREAAQDDLEFVAA